MRDVTRERVLRAVRELGYTPNLAASSLAAAQHTRIALIYTNPSGAYLRELLVGLRVASSSAIQLVIDYWDKLDAESERKAARALAGRVDGVILPPPLCESQAAVNELVKAGIPVVAIASGRLSEALSCVRIDDFSAGKEMTDHLLRQGHTRIGFIRGRDDLSASAPVTTASSPPCARPGLRWSLAWSNTVTTPTGPAWLPPKAVVPTPPTDRDLRQQRRHGRCHIRRAPTRAGVPRDLSVVGFDDTSAATTVWPELTTIHQPIASMANAAVDILLRTIRRPAADATVLRDHVMPHRLIARDSVAARPGGGSAGIMLRIRG